MSRLLDPSEKVFARDLVQELGMVGAHMRSNFLHDVIVRLGARDEAALTGDLFGHVRSFWIAMVLPKRRWRYIGATLAGARVQLCGKLIATLGGARVEDRLPGRQGRLLFAFLVINRNRTLTRAALMQALWPDGQDGGLAPLLSKLRRITPLDEYRIVLPHDTWVDVEAAAEGVHRAESANVQGHFHDAWGPAQVALFVAGRPFLPAEDAPWVDEQRRALHDLHLRAMEAYARACLGIGGTELAAAVRVGRALIAREPYRETGYHLLMDALAREGNRPEGLKVYEKLRRRLRDELGISPSAQSQDLHRQLLRS